MAKGLELVGFGLVGVMILCYVGAFRPAIDAGTSIAFWGCAAGSLGIIIYRKMLKKRAEREGSLENA